MSAHTTFTAIIEIAARSLPVKYEFDKERQTLSVDRFIATSMMYPCNYGYVPDTLGEDGDPLDVLVITPHPIQPGASIAVRPVGMLAMSDDGGIDHKVLCVPVSKLTPLYDSVTEPSHLPKPVLDEIAHFFKHYKDLEPGKWANIEGWESQEKAQKIVDECFERVAPQSD